MKACAPLFALLALTSALTAQNSGVPDGMSYQGFLTDIDGTAIGADAPVNQDLEFRIFTQASGGDPIWGETQTVSVLNGNFSVVLGNGTELNEGLASSSAELADSLGGGEGSEFFFSITPSGGDEFTPRQQLLSAAFAYHAKTAESATVAAGLTAENDTIPVLGANTLNFGDQTRQFLDFLGGRYGMGVQHLEGQQGTLYQRSADDFAWFTNGSHSDEDMNPGSGGTKVASLGEDNHFILYHGGVKIPGSQFIDFGHNHGARPANEGRIGYNLIPDGSYSLDIIGAGGVDGTYNNGQRVVIQANDYTSLTGELRVAGPIKGPAVATTTVDTTRLFADRIDAGRLLVNRIDASDWIYTRGITSDNGFPIFSDRKLKKDITPIEGALDATLRLKPTRYRLTDNDEAPPSFGFIAQEVAEVFPHVATETEDGTLMLYYNQLIPVAIAAIQEQQEIIDGLEQRIETLESGLESADTTNATLLERLVRLEQEAGLTVSAE